MPPWSRARPNSRSSPPAIMTSAARCGPRTASRCKFRVKNPGQRVGSFGLDGTEIIVEGPAPADAGWLNAGAILTMLGDGGDTTAHCAASGKIYVGGRVGTRSGSLMKHDPAYRAAGVVGAEKHRLLLLRVHGRRHRRRLRLRLRGSSNRSSATAPASAWSAAPSMCAARSTGSPTRSGCSISMTPTASSCAPNMPVFLDKIGRPQLLAELTDFSAVAQDRRQDLRGAQAVATASPCTNSASTNGSTGGIFGDVVKDDYDQVAGLVNTGDDRLKIPHWQDKRYGAPVPDLLPERHPDPGPHQPAAPGEGQGSAGTGAALLPVSRPASAARSAPTSAWMPAPASFIDHPVAMKELGRLSQRCCRARSRSRPPAKRSRSSAAVPAASPPPGSCACSAMRSPSSKPTRKSAASCARPSPCERLPREMPGQRDRPHQGAGGRDPHRHRRSMRQLFDTIRRAVRRRGHRQRRPQSGGHSFPRPRAAGQGPGLPQADQQRRDAQPSARGSW